jgi:predicted dienelactone hydrolase
MLAGNAAPPDPKEFLRRPRDVRALLDALDAGSLPGGEGVRAREVTFIGHSWGGTTALQLAGARSLPTALWKDCASASSPLRNISWVLQCSFLPAATESTLADARIARVAAISPPQGLVFAAGLVDLRVPVLLVSGSRDFVVPTRPEALHPFGAYPRGRHELVLVEGGTHFNLPADASSNGGPLRALLLRWARGQEITPTSGLSDPQGLPMRLIPLAASQP